MTWTGWLQIALLLALIAATALPLGLYMARVLAGERTVLSAVFGPVERGFYALAGVDAKRGMDWKAYAFALLLLNALHFLLLYAILRLQFYLPFNPQGMTGMSPRLAFNTAMSFVTNTNWQAYGGEGTLSYGSQMFGLTVHNFLSAATISLPVRVGDETDRRVERKTRRHAGHALRVERQIELQA
jgi:K+-transporting ATPase ATPase A chain